MKNLFIESMAEYVRGRTMDEIISEGCCDAVEESNGISQCLQDVIDAFNEESLGREDGSRVWLDTISRVQGEDQISLECVYEEGLEKEEAQKEFENLIGKYEEMFPDVEFEVEFVSEPEDAWATITARPKGTEEKVVSEGDDQADFNGIVNKAKSLCRKISEKGSKEKKDQQDLEEIVSEFRHAVYQAAGTEPEVGSEDPVDAGEGPF